MDCVYMDGFRKSGFVEGKTLYRGCTGCIHRFGDYESCMACKDGSEYEKGNYGLRMDRKFKEG